MHDPEPVDNINVNFAATFRMMAGILLLVVGILLGLYLANTALGLIFAKEPPAIVTRVTQPLMNHTENAVNIVANEVANNANRAAQPVELSLGIKQLVVYFIVFLLMVIPASIATNLIRGGVKLMRSEESEALEKIAERLS